MQPDGRRQGQQRSSASSRLVRAVGLLLLCLVVAGCFDDYGPTDALRKMPEATLYYPGSQVVDEVANPRNSGPDGQHRASFGHFLAANGTADEVVAYEVVAYYDRELTNRGWTKVNQALGLLDLADGLWSKPGYQFEVSVVAVDQQRRPDLDTAYAGHNLSVDATIFEDWPAESPSPGAS